MIYFIYIIFHLPSSNYTCEQESHAWYLIRSDPLVLHVYVSFHYLENAKAEMQMHKTHMRKCRKDRDICWRLLLNLSRALIKHRRIVSASSQGYILLFTRFSKMHKRGMNDYSRDILPIKLLHLLILLAFIRSGNVCLELKMLELIVLLSFK